MIEQFLQNTNKEITKLKYEHKLEKGVDEMLDILQYHIFLVHTCFNKSEFTVSDVRLKLLEKLKCDD